MPGSAGFEPASQAEAGKTRAPASHAPLGAWKTPISLFIAAVKMTLVFLFFMQLSYQ